MSGKKASKKKKTVALICILVAAIFCASVLTVFLWGSPRYFSGKDNFDISEKEKTGDITVMSFNIRYTALEDRFNKSWFHRAPLVVEVISEVKPDIIGFQEVNTAHERYLKKHLQGYSFIVAYRTNDILKEGMMIAYRSDRFLSSAEGHFWLSETPEKMSKDWGTGSYRVAAYTTLTDKATDKIFTVMDTHLDNASKEARAKGIEVIMQQKEKLGFGTMILMGDMNDTDDSPMYKTATENNLVDARKVAASIYDGPGSTWHNYGAKLNGKRIDYFFISPSISVKNYVVFDKTFDGVYPSDHFPLYINVTIG